MGWTCSSEKPKPGSGECLSGNWSVRWYQGRRQWGVITLDCDEGLSWNSKHQPLTNSSPRHCGGASRTPAQCISTHQTLMHWNGVKNVKWNVITSLDSLLAFQFLCTVCAILFTVSSFKVAVTIWLRNSKHTKNGIFCVKMSHWNSDTSFSQSVQCCEANRAQTLLGKKSLNKCCVYVTIYLFRATSIWYSWLDLKITACENANNNLCNFKWVFARCFDAYSLNAPMHIWIWSL